MGRESVARHFFYFLLLFGPSLTFYVDSYAFPGNSGNGVDASQWDQGSGRKKMEGLHWSPWPLQGVEGHPEEPGRIQQRPLEETDDREKWLKVLSFDEAKSLSETDRRADNESKITVLSEKEHFEIYENNEEEENGNGLGENIFHLLNPENFLSRITAESQSGDLQRSKREAEDDQKKKRRCRCRRVMRRRRVRRRRRRRRNGQQNGRRRRRQRRGRRRCVCRRRGGGAGKDDGGGSEESGGGGDEGEGEGDEAEGDGGEGGDEGDGDEGEEDGESEGDEGSDEDTDEESSEEEEEDEEEEGEQLIAPGNVIPIPPGSVVVVPEYPMPPPPHKLPPPNIVPSVGGKFGSKP